MAVFRIEKTRDYTVMSNHHLKNKNLTLKAKGLLSVMLSLPETWDYTLKGLAIINREGVDAIREAVRELEKAGYIVRTRVRNAKGRLTGTEYVIYHRRNLSGTCKAQTAGQLSQHFNRRRLHSHAPDMGRHCAGWDCRACDCAWKAEKKRQALSTITCKSAVEASSHPRRNPLLSSFGRVHTAFAQNP